MQARQAVGVGEGFVDQRISKLIEAALLSGGFGGQRGAGIGRRPIASDAGPHQGLRIEVHLPERAMDERRLDFRRAKARGRVTPQQSTLPSDRRPEIRYELRNNRGILWADDVVLDENWWLGSLAEIAPQAADVGGDVIELGRPPVVTGWLTLYGRRAFDPSGNPDENLVPPILGVFRERVRSRGFETGHALVGRGEMDGLEGPFGNQQ